MREVWLARALLASIERAAARAWPDEACGLVIGGTDALGAPVIDGVALSGNVATDPAHRFEIDPRVFLSLERALRASATRRILGVFHTHPRGAAVPSAHDRAVAWGPGAVWLITAMADGRATETRAYALAPRPPRLRPIGLRLTDSAVVQNT